MTDGKENGNSDDVEQLRSEIERTRERFAAEAGALGTKLSPDHLKAEVKRAMTNKAHEVTEHVREGAQHLRTTVADGGDAVASFASRNTVPLALIGVGVGWLIWSTRNDGLRARRPSYAVSSRSEVYDPWTNGEQSSNGHHLTDKLKNGLSSAKASATEQAHHAREKLNELESSARQTAVQAKDLASRTLAEQPLVLGALAIGAGVAVGLSLPSTESENALIGKYRDKLFSKARAQVEHAELTASGD
jgi:hypothetical protein